ncbi:MAG: 50S ribosomal protein L2 [Candidatus Margulisiibacteriota bacterium]
MPVKAYKPTSPGLRTKQSVDFEFSPLTKPEKRLLKKVSKSSGRNNQGKITVRHKGGGVKRKFRVIDFKRNGDDVLGTVAAIEYDPNRSAFIALVAYGNGNKEYILAPHGIKVGDVISSGEKADIKLGNALKLRNIPAGTTIHNIEISVGSGAKLVRSAGSGAVLMAKNEDYATVKLPSGEVRLVSLECKATIGQVSNLDNRNVSLGKAGASRRKGIRPAVRGSVMNPNDHPHGGGEGKAPIGRSGPVTPWGKPALGYKTRTKKNKSNKLIVKRRG